MISLVFALALAMADDQSAAAGAARPTEVAPAQVTAPAPDAEDRVVCKKEPLLGSRVAKKVCMRKSEWKAREDAAEKFVNDASSRGSIGKMPSNPFGG